MSEPAVRLAAVPKPDPTPAAPAEEPRGHRAGGHPPAPEAASLPPLLIDMAGLSRLLARSEASLYRDDAAGRIPAGRKLGASKRWIYSEIVAWVDAGMPCRRQWEAMKGTKNASGRPR
jgi:predicted DNA-binding transcriptional regulator AlpA